MYHSRISVTSTVVVGFFLIIAINIDSSFGQDYISQQNIGIPGSDTIDISGRPAVTLAKNTVHRVHYVDASEFPAASAAIASSSLGGFAGGLSGGSYSTGVGGTSLESRAFSSGGRSGSGGGDYVSTGGRMPVTLAKNSVHRTQYVDASEFPAVSSAIRGAPIAGRFGGGSISPVGIASSTGGSSSVSSSRGRSFGSPNYITQQNIGTYGIDDGIGSLSGGSISGGSYPGGVNLGGISGSSGFSGIPGGSYGGAYGMVYGGSVGGGPIQLPVNSRHSVEYVDVPSGGTIHPVSVEVPAQPLGIDLNFRSSSSLKVSQSHQSSPGSYQETSSVDEPIRLSHTVHRPIIQELHETIVPSRRITQEVRPVQEEIRTIIATRGGTVRGGYSTGGGGSYGGITGAGVSAGRYPGSGISSGGGIIRGGQGGSSYVGGSSGSGGYGVGSGTGYKTRPGHYGSSSSSGGGLVGSVGGTGSGIGGSSGGGISSGIGAGSGHGGVVGSSSGSSSVSGGPLHRYGGASSDGSSGERRFYDGSYGIGQKKI